MEPEGLSSAGLRRWRADVQLRASADCFHFFLQHQNKHTELELSSVFWPSLSSGLISILILNSDPGSRPSCLKQTANSSIKIQTDAWLLLFLEALKLKSVSPLSRKLLLSSQFCSVMSFGSVSLPEVAPELSREVTGNRLIAAKSDLNKTFNQADELM